MDAEKQITILTLVGLVLEVIAGRKCILLNFQQYFVKLQVPRRRRQIIKNTHVHISVKLSCISSYLRMEI